MKGRKIRIEAWLALVGILAIAAFGIARLVSVVWPQADEEAVRELCERMVSAVLSEDFEEEWECFGSYAQAEWESKLAEWKRLDPKDDGWAELRRVHGVSRSDVLDMEAEEFFVASRFGRVRSEPDWWATERSHLESRPRGRLEFTDEDTARLSFDVETDADWDINERIFVFERDREEWRFRQAEVCQMRFWAMGWSQPELELALAEGAAEFSPSTAGTIVNLLTDGRVIGCEREISLERLRKWIGPPKDERVKSSHDQLTFRCDRRVPYRDAAPWLSTMAEYGSRNVWLAVTSDPEFKCRPRTPKSRKPTPQPHESKIDLVPPTDSIYPWTVSAVIEIGPELLDEGGRTALSAEHLGDRVVVCPSPDATWEAVVRVLAFLETAGIKDVLLSSPSAVPITGGARVSRHTPLESHPALRRIFTRRPDLERLLAPGGD